MGAVTGNRKLSAGAAGSVLKLRGACPVTQRPHLPTPPTHTATTGCAARLCQTHAGLHILSLSWKLQAKEDISEPMFPVLMARRCRQGGTNPSSLGAGEMAQRFRAFLTVAEDLGSVASTYSSSRHHFLLDSEYVRVHMCALTYTE